MRIAQYLPNLITMLSLVTGCIAITMTFNQRLVTASWLIGIAILFDFLDGFAARMLSAKSDLGKQLDSLADVISFGLAPGLIIFMLLTSSLRLLVVNETVKALVPYISMLIPAFSALRLARFNIDARQTLHFHGLPTPANAIFLASLPLILSTFPPDHWIHRGIMNVYFLGAISVVMPALLVSGIKLFGLKFTNFKWHDNLIKYIFLFVSLLLVIFLKFLAFPVIILFYILLSLIFHRSLK
jgi:CDP-diacylglycerol--serine O-phosphatidyltransferase